MTQAGLPLTAYEALQLHQGAPRELVERAYWHLAAIQQRLPDSRTVTEELQRLNTAYHALVDPTLTEKRDLRRTNHAAAHKPSPTRRRGLWFGNRGPETTSDGRTNHEVLFVAPVAQREIIDLAHAWRITQLKGRRNGDAAEYDLVNHAYAALCGNPTDAPPPPDAASVVEALQPAIADETDATPTPDAPPLIQALELAIFGETVPTAANVAPPDAGQAATVSSVPAPTAEAAQPVDPAVRRLTDLASKANHYAANGIAPPAPPLTTRGDALPADAPAEPLAPVPAARESSPDSHPPIEHAVPLPAVASTRSDGSAAEPLPEPAQSNAPRLLRTILSRFHPTSPVDATGDGASPPKSKRELTDAAERSRLMTLRSDRSHIEAITPAAAAPAERIQRASLARLTFIAGLRAGESVPIYDEPMSLGTNPRSGIILPDEHGVIAREHARLWRHGESFLFREVDGESTIVGGAPLTLPVVILEDQDEIAIGDNIMRFTCADAPQQADAESSSAATHHNARPA